MRGLFFYQNNKIQGFFFLTPGQWKAYSYRAVLRFYFKHSADKFKVPRGLGLKRHRRPYDHMCPTHY